MKSTLTALTASFFLSASASAQNNNFDYLKYTASELKGMQLLISKEHCLENGFDSEVATFHPQFREASRQAFSNYADRLTVYNNTMQPWHDELKRLTSTPEYLEKSETLKNQRQLADQITSPDARQAEIDRLFSERLDLLREQMIIVNQNIFDIASLERPTLEKPDEEFCVTAVQNMFSDMFYPYDELLRSIEELRASREEDFNTLKQEAIRQIYPQLD